MNRFRPWILIAVVIGTAALVGGCGQQTIDLSKAPKSPAISSHPKVPTAPPAVGADGKPLAAEAPKPK